MPQPRIRRNLSRRTFLSAAAATASAGVIGFPAVLRGKNLNDKLSLALVGVGGRGGDNLKQMTSENVVAICDVNAKNLAQAAESCADAQQHTDFRKMFDELKDTEFDAVVVSVPEHVHAFVTMQALARGKHVYCEKPLTRDVFECRTVIQAAAKAKVATQMGTQIHAGENYRRVVELIQAGAIGPVSECHVWVSRAWGWQSEADAKKNGDIVWSYDRPEKADPVPPHLDWDLWVGPAPNRPYNNVYFPGPKWYRWWDFGNGTMSDLGSHWNDLPWWALKLDAPKAIEASGPPAHAEIAPASMSATYEYAARGEGLPALKLTWHQGASKPKQFTEKLIPQWGNGVLFVGTNGRMLLSDYDKHVLLPEAEFKDFVRPEKSIPPSIGHHQEWIRACKTGEPTTCNFAYAGPLTEANHLGNVAYRAGKRLEWDAKGMKIPNAPEAERFLSREYCNGWSLT